ncbi:glycosyltransferase family 8 protein [Loktanella sp. SALINAS62]|uniref:glycosyltransferase family 8 protein n=1 Tax=Loktanella sp. SALINAS62 TaxID=2706124 RepID=UPI001B8B6AA1
MQHVRPPVRKAIIITCDNNHLPYAATVFHSICRFHPDRDFDLILATDADFAVPPILDDMGVRVLRMTPPDDMQKLKSSRLPRTAYLRLWLPQRLAGEYARLIYLDTDMWLQRNGLDQLFDADLGAHPVGAVLERPLWARPYRRVRDQRRLNMARAPYFNSGLLLIDTAAWVSADVLNACLKAAKQHGDLFQYHDQSLLNYALYRNWAQIHPSWNWQWVFYHPMSESLFDPALLHIYGPHKPWDDPEGRIPGRVKAEFRLFLNRHFPDRPQRYGPMQTTRSRRLTRRTLRHLRDVRAFRKYVARFADEFSTLHQLHDAS